MSAREELTALAVAQRDAEVARLLARADELKQVASFTLLRHFALRFVPGDPGFERAAAVAASFLTVHVERIEHVSFIPGGDEEWPSVKVRASYGPGGPYCGAERDVSSDMFLATWEASGVRHELRDFYGAGSAASASAENREERSWHPMLPMNRRARRWQDLSYGEQNEVDREWPAYPVRDHLWEKVK